MRIYAYPLCLFFFTLLSFSVSAQITEPEVMVEPKDWKFERIDLPLDFAPDLPYAGFEELRFAPGMFDTSSSNYFTYVFYISVAKYSIFTKRELKQFLHEYYRGLSAAVAKDKDMKVDVSQIKVKLKRLVNSTATSDELEAKLKFIDTFTNGQLIDLNMKIHVHYSPHFERSIIFAMVSPKSTYASIWDTFDELKAKLFRRR